MQIDAPKAKYPETQVLIQRARDHGLTQNEIGVLCGVQQSIISDWLNGKKIARVEQIEPLLEKFGDVGIAAKPSVYLVYDHKGFEINDAVFKTLEEFIADVQREHKKAVQEREFIGKVLPDYRQPKRIADPELRKKFEYEIGRYEMALQEFEAVRSKYMETERENEFNALKQTRIQLFTMKGDLFKDQDEFLELFSHLPDRRMWMSGLDYKTLRNDLLAAAHKYESRIVQIEGDIIFDYVFEMDKDDPGPMWNRSDKKIPWMKWVVHDLGGGKFCWLVQHPKKTYFPIGTKRQPDDVWLAKIEEADDVTGILSSAGNYPLSSAQKSAVDFESLLYLMTKAFLDKRHHVEGIELIPKQSI